MVKLLRMNTSVPASVLDRYRRRVTNDLSQARASLGCENPVSGAGKPFLIVTPLGLPHIEALAEGLCAANVGVRARGTLANWPRASTLLYMREYDTRRLFKAWVFEALWRTVFRLSHAEIWWLDSVESYRRLADIKDRFREALAPSRVVKVEANKQAFHARLHALHLPDQADLPRDTSWVLANEWRALACVHLPQPFRR